MVSSVSRRIEKALQYLGKEDAENCLINLFPAIDKVAKKRRPSDRVGDRIRGFVTDEEKMIWGIATKNIFVGKMNGMTFAEAIYKYGRTSIVHEGELDKRLKFSNSPNVIIGAEWELNLHFVLGLIVAVIVAPECRLEKMDLDIEITLFTDKKFEVNNIWGQKSKIQEIMCELWSNPNLFA